MELRKAVALLSVLVLALLGSDAEGVSVRTGRHFSLIITDEGRVLAAGRNEFGQLGINSSLDMELDQTPVTLPDGATAVGAAGGAFHSLFLMDSGLVYSAGRNNFGQLGVPSAVTSELPVLVEGLEDVVEVAAGYGHSLFLLSNGTVRAVGMNNQGQLGNGEVSRATQLVTPILPVNTTVKAIAAGYDFSFFLTEAGDVYAAGNGLGGQLGDGSGDVQATPAKALGGILAVAAGEAHSLFVTTDRRLFGTGANFDGQLGVSNRSALTTPIEIVAGTVEDVFAGGDSSCYITGGDAALFGMGSNRKGQLGLGNITTAMMPAQIEVASNPTFSAAALGDDHGLYAATIDIDAVFAAGDNAYGQLADGSLLSSATLMEVYLAPSTRTNTATASATTTEKVTRTATTTEGGMVTLTATETHTVTVTATRDGQNVPVDRSRVYFWLGSVLVAGCALGFALNYGVASGSAIPAGDDPNTEDTEGAQTQLELARATMAQDG